MAGHICAEPDEATVKAWRMSWDGIYRDQRRRESSKDREEDLIKQLT